MRVFKKSKINVSQLKPHVISPFFNLFLCTVQYQRQQYIVANGQPFLVLCELALCWTNIFANFLFGLCGVVDFENILGIQFEK